MILTREKAFELLREAELCNPGPWVTHSILVAECAEKIAARTGLDSERAYLSGLMHDIGRKFGTGHFAHITDGFHYLNGLHYPDYARICLTHSFCLHTTDAYIGKRDISEYELQQVSCRIESIEYDDYDLLIQLCDCLAGGTAIVSMAERFADIALRYGSYPQKKIDVNYGLKKYFETLAQENIYRIVTNDPTLWDL